MMRRKLDQGAEVVRHLWGMERAHVKREAFTIVELLIVIVVIGILAAISIVLYSGVSHRAHQATVSSAVSQVAKKVAVYSVENGTPPADLADLPGVGTVSGVWLDYIVGEGGDPSAWCVGGTRSGVRYYQSSAGGSVAEGGCIPSPIQAASSVSMADGVRTVVFVGESVGTTSRYAIDFRTAATVYAYIPGSGTSINASSGVATVIQDGLATVHYTRAAPAAMYIGQRYSKNEKWTGAFRAEVYAEVLTPVQINSVAGRLKAELRG